MLCQCDSRLCPVTRRIVGFTFLPFITALHCTSACYVMVRGRGDAITLQSSG